MNDGLSPCSLDTYREYMKHTVLSPVRDSLRNGHVQSLKEGEDRRCSGNDGDANSVKVFYEWGALGTAYLINRSKSDSRTFWTSKSKGFWNAIVPHDTWDYVNDLPSSVPEGKGWKKAFTDFSGDAKVDDFYAVRGRTLKSTLCQSSTISTSKYAVVEKARGGFKP